MLQAVPQTSKIKMGHYLQIGPRVFTRILGFMFLWESDDTIITGPKRTYESP